MKKIYCCLILLFFNQTFSQAPGIDWQGTIGGYGYEYIYSVNPTFDGGYILSGTSDSSNTMCDKTENCMGDLNIWVVKTDSLGNVEWENTLQADNFWAGGIIQQTSDGNYMVIGASNADISGDKTEDSRGLTDLWLLKLDPLGNIIWQKTIGGSSQEGSGRLLELSDGYLILSATYSPISGEITEGTHGSFDSWLLKIDFSGNIIWQKTYGGDLDDSFSFILPMEDGGYLLCGASDSSISGNKTENSRGLIDYWIIKIDSVGNILWQKTIGGSEDDRASGIIKTTDGGYIIVGNSYSPISGEKTVEGIYSEAWVIKIDAYGNILWQQSYGGDSADKLYNIIETLDGNFLLVGESASGISGDKTQVSRGDYDCWILKIDGLGNILWDKTIGGNNDDVGVNLVMDQIGGVLIGGQTFSGVYGDITEGTCLNGSDYWLVKLEPENLSTNLTLHSRSVVYPNPTTAVWQFETKSCIKSISVTDISGKIVFFERFSAISGSINAEHLAAGMYFATIKTTAGSEVVKLIKN